GAGVLLGVGSKNGNLVWGAHHRGGAVATAGAPPPPPVHAAMRVSVSCRVMAETLITAVAADSRPLWLLTESDLPRWLGEQTAEVANWVRGHAFQAEKHRVLTLPDARGGIAGAVVGLGSLRCADDLKVWHSAGLSDRLPAQTYHI